MQADEINEKKLIKDRPMFFRCILLVFILGFNPMIYAQNIENKKGDTIPITIPTIKPIPDLYRMPFADCKPVQVFLYADSTKREIVYLRKNFTDQFLEVCATSQLIPSSRIYGFASDSSFYRSGLTNSGCHVFAERILKGSTSLYYCRNIPMNHGLIEYISTDSHNSDYRNYMIIEEETPMRYKNDYSYFITPKSDTTKMILVDNNNVKYIADTYLINCKAAYNDALKFTQRYKTIQTITLPVGIISLGFCYIGDRARHPHKFFENPLLGLSVAALATYVFFRIKGKNKFLHPNDMLRIITTLNNC